MTDTLTNVRDYLNDINEKVEEKANDIMSEIEDALDNLSEYENLFDDVYDARDAKEYTEEMSDIFDDVYDAQQAREFIDQLSYEGIDDWDDFESYKDTLKDELKGEFEADNEELLALRVENDRLNAIVGNLLNALGAVTVEFHESQLQKLRIELADEARASEEKAYEAGLTDAMILHTNPPTPVDPATLDEESNDE